MDEKDHEKLTTRTGIKGNVYFITITDNKPEHWPELISIAKSNYDYYAYIYHDQDKDASGALIAKHLHLVCQDKKGPSIKTHIDRFSGVVPSNFVEKVKSERAITRYLLHEDDLEKYHYTKDMVETNNRERFLSQFKDVSNSLTEFRDFCLVRSGKMSVEEFIVAHQGQLYNLNLYQKINLFRSLDFAPNQRAVIDLELTRKELQQL